MMPNQQDAPLSQQLHAVGTAASEEKRDGYEDEQRISTHLKEY